VEDHREVMKCLEDMRMEDQDKEEESIRVKADAMVKEMSTDQREDNKEIIDHNTIKDNQSSNNGSLR